MDEKTIIRAKPKKEWRERIGFYVIIFAVAFLLGFVPMWFTARKYAAESDSAKRALRLAQLQNLLASATIDARRGEYEPARQSASNFFSLVDAEIRGDTLFNTAQREDITSLMSQRYDLITLLAHNDPAAAERLADLYIAYRRAVESSTQQN